MQYQCQSPEASSAMSRVGSRLLAGRSGVLVFSWGVPGEWKFFRRTVDLSTLSPVLSEKLVYGRLFGMNEGWPVHSMSDGSTAVFPSFAGCGRPVWYDDNPFARKKRYMQTDTWLTETTHPDCCPLCSQPLPAGSNTCASCGFTAHEPARGSSAAARGSAASARQPNPVTPIPARASALRSREGPGGASARSVSSPSRSTPFFAPSSAEQAEGRRHESPNYEAVSSLSSLSLIISETPTAPPRTTMRLPRQTGRLEHIDEIDTVPQKPGAGEIEADASEALVPPGSLSLRFDDLDVPDRALVPSAATPPA